MLINLRSIFSGYGVNNSSALPIPPKSSVPPATALNPEATAGGITPASAPPIGSHSLKLHPLPCALLVMTLIASFAIF